VPVLEDSVADFIERHRQNAVPARLYPQPEGSPLLEVRLEALPALPTLPAEHADVERDNGDPQRPRPMPVLYLFDRVGPYAARPGFIKIIVNPMVETLTPSQEREGQLHTIGVSQVVGVGQVLAIERHEVVVMARSKLVIGVFDLSWKHCQVGQWVSFESVAPVHGFIV
jgi:hypothetical protein